MSVPSNPPFEMKPLRSALLQEDPSFYELVQEFVESLPVRLNEIRAAYEQQDFATLKTLAHRLKGSGGSFGYPQITQVAAEMERAFKQQQTAEIDHWMAQLRELLNAARAGLNEVK